MIVGSAGERRESIERLRRFLRSDPCADVQLTLETPFPGTALRRRLAAQGRLLPERDWSHYTLFDLTYRPDAMAAAELEAAFVDLLAETFGLDQARRRQAIRRDVWRRSRIAEP